METNDIKETWKAGIERTIKPYPEERLNEMVVNSARKSIKTVYPGTVFRLKLHCRGRFPHRITVRKRAKRNKNVFGYGRFGRVVRLLFPLGTLRIQDAEVYPWNARKGMVGIPYQRD